MFQGEASYSYSVSVAPSDAVSRAGAPDQGLDVDRQRYAVFSLKLLHAFWGDKGLRDIDRSRNFELPQKKQEEEGDNEPNKKEDDIKEASQIFVDRTTEFIFCRSPASPDGAFHEEDSVATLEDLIMSWNDMDAVSPMAFFYEYDGKTPSTVQLQTSGDNGFVRFESILARSPANVGTSVFALKSASCKLNSASGTAQLGLHGSDEEETFNVKEINIGGESFGQTTEDQMAGLDFSGKVYGAEKHHSNCFMIWLLGELGPQGLDRFVSDGADGSKTLCLKLGLKKKLDKAEQLLLFLVSQLDHQKTADYRRSLAETQEGAAQRETLNVVNSRSAEEFLSRASSTPSGDDDDDDEEFHIGAGLNNAALGKNISNSGLSRSSTPTNEPPPSFSASLRQDDKEEEEEEDDDADEEDEEDKKEKEKKRQEWNQVNKAAGGYRTNDELEGGGGIPRTSDNEELTIRLTAADSEFILKTYRKLCQEYGLLTLQRKEEEQPARLPALYFHVLGAGKKTTVSYTLTGFFLQQPASSVAVPGASSAVTTADAGADCQWIEEFFPTTLDSGLPESVCVVENPQTSFSKNDNAAGAVVETSSSSCSFCLEFIAHRKCNDDAKLRSGDPAGQAPEQCVRLEDDEEDKEQGDQERGQIQSSSRCQCSKSVATSSSGSIGNCSVCCSGTAYVQEGPGAPKGEEDSSSCHCASTNSHSCPRSLSQSKPVSSSDCSCCKSSHKSGGFDGSSCTFCKLHSAKPSVVSVPEGECSCGGKSGSPSSSKSGSVPCSVCNRHSAEPSVVSVSKGECSCEKNSGSSSVSKSASGSCSACKCSETSSEQCPDCRDPGSNSSVSAPKAAAVASENSSSALEKCPFCREGANSSSSVSYCVCPSEASRSSGFQVIKASPTSSKKAVIRARRDYAPKQSCMIINLPVAF